MCKCRFASKNDSILVFLLARKTCWSPKAYNWWDQQHSTDTQHKDLTAVI